MPNEEQQEPREFDGIRHPKKRALLIAMARTGNVVRAAILAKIDHSTHYWWMKNDSEYAVAFEVAKDRGADMMEAELYRRIYDGIEEPVFHAGKRALDVQLNDDGSVKMGPNGKPLAIPAVVRKFTDATLIFGLKGALPRKYRDNSSVELTGKDGKPLLNDLTLLKQTLIEVVGELPPEQRTRVAQQLLAADNNGHSR